MGDTVADLSLDICAYDQRGCLSPQLVYIEETTSRSTEHFAKRLADEGLGSIGKTLPRGPLPVSIGAVQAQWRGIAEVVEPRLSKCVARSRSRSRRSDASDGTDRLEPKMRRCRFSIPPRGPSATRRKPRAQRIRMHDRHDADPVTQRPRRRPPNLARPLPNLVCGDFRSWSSAPAQSD